MKTRVSAVLVVFGLILCFQQVKAQQHQFYTQYMFNDYLVNPAVAGTHNYFQIRANSRIQWVGMTDAPRTMSVSMYGPWEDKSMGYGGYVYHDVTGPTSQTALNGTYSYNMPINESMRISGGISIGFMQYRLDGTEIYSGENNNDPALTGGVDTRFVPDASVGVYLYSSYFYVGLSAHQLLGWRVSDEVDGPAPGTNPNNIAGEGVSRLKQHVYLSGGTHFWLSRDFTLQPSILVKALFPDQYQAEINAKVTYQNQVWGGLSYRTSDAISVLLGYNYENKVYFGISYDVTVSDLARYTSGTYEVMIAYRFNDIK